MVEGSLSQTINIFVERKYEALVYFLYIMHCLFVCLKIRCLVAVVLSDENTISCLNYFIFETHDAENVVNFCALIITEQFLLVLLATDGNLILCVQVEEKINLLLCETVLFLFFIVVLFSPVSLM